MAEALWSAAPLVLRALQEAQLFELLERRFHRYFGGVGIDVEGIDNLFCDLPSRPLTVALVPDEAGGLVELVNQIRPTVQHHRLAVDETSTDVRSSLWVFGHPDLLSSGFLTCFTDNVLAVAMQSTRISAGKGAAYP
jgi:hypothetical protein